MNFVLKIVEGPNRGAEIALVEGVAVTLGKGDDCDIVLADPTLPSAPTTIEASADGVTADGVALAQFAVKTVGATSFAVGPADAPWEDLKWPAKTAAEEPKPERGGETTEKNRKEEAEPSATTPESGESPAEPEDKERKRVGCLGCLGALVLLLLALVCLAWFCRDRLGGSERLGQLGKIGRYWYSKRTSGSRDSGGSDSCGSSVSLTVVAMRYGLSIKEGDGPVRLSGNLKTRAERLRATAEAYAARPGVELDLSDDESFRTAADDALFTLTEGALKVHVATNRVLSIVGVSRSPEELSRTLKALNADVPRLRDVDVAGVRFGKLPKRESIYETREDPGSGYFETRPSRLAAKKASRPNLPVCGILTKPYPCLVMRDGTRVMEGASLGESVILKIEADAVTVTNSTGRFVWKP